MDTKETKIYVAVLIGVAVLTIILVYFISTIIRYHRRNRELYKTRINAEIDTLEKERKRIAADMHDELGPLVVSIKLKLNSLDIKEREDVETLNAVYNNIGELINRMKEISNDLLPILLIKKGLLVAMEVSADEISRSGALRFSFRHNNVPQLSEHITVNLYRILQEILHNTIKHAEASELSIEINADEKKLFVSTADNGKGFDYYRASAEQAGLGLRNMLSRIELLKGEMFIESSRHRGTRYSFELPF